MLASTCLSTYFAQTIILSSLTDTREVLFQLLFRGDDMHAIQMEPIELRLERIRVVVKPLESLESSLLHSSQVGCSGA